MDTRIKQILEFFADNDIFLTEEQIENLKEKILNETKAHGYAIMKLHSNGDNRVDYNDVEKLERFTREIDVYNNKLKRGEISKEEFKYKINKVKEKAGSLSQYISDDGSKSMDKYLNGRPNKSNVDPNKLESEEDKKNYNEKINRQYAVANSSDNNKEVLERKKSIQKQSGTYNDETKNSDIWVKFDKDDGNPKVITNDSGKDKGKNLSIFKNKLYHNDSRDNVTELSPTAKSKEGALYGSERIYASEDKPDYTRDGNTYQINKKDIPKNSLHKDSDIDGHKSYYIETDKKIKVNKSNKK